MANKYVIEGAAVCGDGTGPGIATTPGEPNCAWNVLVGAGGVFENAAPAYGTPIAAGDTVYVRTKSAAGADITRAMSANTTVGSSAGTESDPVTWVFDNGVVWPGVSGSVTYETASAGVQKLTLRLGNRFIAGEHGNFTVRATSPGSYGALLEDQGCYVENFKVDASNRTSSNLALTALVKGYYKNLKVVIAKLSTVANDVDPFIISYEYRCILENLDFEITNATNAGGSLFGSSGFQSTLYVRGGKVHGAGVNGGVAIYVPYTTTSNGHRVFIQGMQIPKVIQLYQPAQAFPGPGNGLFASGLDGGSGSIIYEDWGFADNRNITYNYPTLNATWPDSVASPMSWRLYPGNTSRSRFANLVMNKLYVDNAAQKKVQLEIAVADSWVGSIAPDKSNTWIEVSYIDESGIIRQVDSLGTGPLDSSPGVTWSPENAGKPYWGPVTCTKRRLEVTTPTAIKKDTMVSVRFYTYSRANAVTNDYIFVCPDIQLAAP